MADDGPQGIDSSLDSGRVKRPAPTLDLEATKVTEKAAEREASSEPEPADAAPPEAAARASRTGSVAISALTGAIAAGLVLGVVWLAGWPGQNAAPPAPVASEADHAAVDALVARVASIESKSATPAQPSTDPAAAAKIDALEKSVASLREQLTTARGQSERLVAAINELKAAPRDASAPPPDLSAVNDKIAALESALQAQSTEQTKAEQARQAARPVDDKPLRRVVAATLLDLSVRTSEPYAAALTAAKALAPDAGVLKPLEPFATSGVPNPNALSRDLLAELLPKAAPEAPTATTGTGIIDRLEAGAVRLGVIKIERTGSATGGDRTAAVVRAAALVQRNDTAGARRELSSLSGAERAAVQPGLDRLEARDAALAASRQFAADSLAALSKP